MLWVGDVAGQPPSDAPAEEADPAAESADASENVADSVTPPGATDEDAETETDSEPDAGSPDSASPEGSEPEGAERAVEPAPLEEEEPAPPSEEPPPPPEEGEGDLGLDVGRIEELDLAALLNAEVVTASRRAERLSVSPGTISLIRREDVEEYRPLDLYERISMLPGIELIESYFGYTQLTFRGLLQTHYNNKSLFMINGHPLYTPVVGSYFLSQAPQTAIDRVEVVRGPASSLYATNAYGGAINLLTRTPGDEPHAEVYALGGSFYRRRLGFAVTGRAGDFGLYLFGELDDSDGYEFRADRDEDGLEDVRVRRPGVRDGYETDRMSFYGGATYQDLRLNLGYFQIHRDKFGLIPTVTSTGPRDLRGWLADLSGSFELAPGHQLNASLRYDGFWKYDDFSHYPPVAAAPGSDVSLRWLSHKIGFDLSYRASFLEDEALNLLVGASFDYLASPFYTFNYTEDAVDPMTGNVVAAAGQPWESASPWTDLRDYADLGLYANGDYRIVDWLKVVAGVLVNWNSRYDFMVAPRAAVIMPFSDEFTLKAMYGRSYRAPSLFEQWVDTPNVLFGGNLAGQTLGSGNLQPEVLDSVELAGEWRPGNFFVRLTGYYMRTDSLIERGGVVPADSELGNTRDTPAYSNNPGQQLTGAELEIEGRPVEQLRLFFNATGRVGFDEDGARLPYWYAPVLANAGASWRPLEVLSLQLTGQFVGPRFGTMGVGTANERDVFLDPYFLLNARVAVRPHDLVEVSVSARNILNMSYQYPEYIRQNVNTVPGGPGFQLYGEVALRL